MRLSAIERQCAKGYFTFVEIRKNPGIMTEYIALLYGRDGKSFMLCDESDSVVSKQELGDIVELLKQAGLRKAKIYF